MSGCVGADVSRRAGKPGSGEPCEIPEAWSVRNTGVEHLAERALKRAVGAINTRLDDKDPDVRSAAVLALRDIAEIFDRRTTQAVRPRLVDENPQVQRAAVDVLKELTGRNRRKSVAGLRAALDHEVQRSQSSPSLHANRKMDM
mmetsp:Transcript_37816/g.100639  ORF Transcript_37816/g.100639 Transcript_37816/m.100639 type:complete len:144 (-) Transcript_37816:307-738(-)|eukprot:CAMPEP_0194530170 /NCGR_PEP_ID=MMETSP0253-20130528/67037_1 /TAXON_ID=2966 /ORGANISM="Noctiluca scintillans" /LENGTH=143 /DNA_ID=CAMNT_0039375365 /DNA_START=22 /DNA_END=453 /DNA_ORIENTATION=-